MYRKRDLIRTTALRASVDVSDVRLERKSRYEYAKLKARGHSRTRTRYASATPVATGSDSLIRSNPLPPTTIGEKRSRAQGDPCHVVRKHPRRMVNPSEEVSHTPMSSLNPGTRATSQDTGIGPDDDILSGPSHHGTGGSLVCREASVVVGVLKEGHDNVLLELSGLRETLGKAQSALDATQARVQTLELGLARVEGQLDLLIWMQHPMTRPYYTAQAPPSSRGTDPDTA